MTQAQTTIMKQSNVGDAWIRDMYTANPIQRIMNEAGQPNGNILTGPVRLAFCDSLLEAKPKMSTDPNSKLAFQTVVMFPPMADLAIFWEEWYKVAGTSFANYWDAANQRYHTIDNPFHDQGTKAATYAGFTPGCMFTTMSSNYKPPVVDMRNNPIVDPSKVYAGVWAIIATNCYASGLRAAKKGPRFGLQTVMIIGDDLPLGGGAADPRQQFRGVSVKPPAVMPANFGQVPPPGAPGMPGAPPPNGTAAFYPPPMGGPTYAPPPNNDEDLSQFT